MQITSSHNSINALMILKKILKVEFSTIFEFGSRYGEDTIELARLNPDSIVYSFECNPNTLDECKRNVDGYKNIYFTNSAIGNIDGEIDFYSIDEKNTISEWPDGNQGASSLLKASETYYVEKYSQNKIRVPITTLKRFMEDRKIPEISLLWMDIQGAEKMALEGLGEKISNVKIIHLEVEFKEIYQGQPLFKEMHNYFIKNNFTLLGFTNIGKTAGDAVYLNKNTNMKRVLFSKIFLFFIMFYYKSKTLFIMLFNKFKLGENSIC
jgi:FkbM family methyltransferase